MEIRISRRELYNSWGSNQMNEYDIVRRYIGNRLKTPYVIIKDSASLEYICREESLENNNV